ncbi:LptA/OstA family protein [uncultured Victivallis sp.]|uniref:LptA/OstA family protein n=1 Tax=uncultured Victivallis sp. TaxID=354118 RepID=UPI0025DD4382|nr:LptA/OstA family protein [uncultured Victivallis sp.]
MKKLIFAALLAGSALALRGAGDLEDLRGLVLSHAKLPLYNKQVLQSMAFFDKASRQGRLMVGSNVLLDLIRRGADIDSIKDGWGVKLYPLNSGLPEIVGFWKERLYSEGIMSSPRADVDQENRMAAGNEPVHFRSPLLDLDGIGFEADFDKRTILVKSDVRIVVRMAGSDPRKLFAAGAKLPEKYEFITATGDSLLIDLGSNQVILMGNVKVDEERSGVTCERMTIFLDRKGAGNRGEAAVASAAGIENENMKGVSRILCDGNVVIFRKLSAEELRAGEQKALADHMVYDVKSASVTLSGDREYPRIVRGGESISGRNIVLFKEEQRATVTDDCRVVISQPPEKDERAAGPMTVRSKSAHMDYRNNCSDFLGDVRVDEPRMELLCDRMRVILREVPGAKAVAKTAESSGSLTGMPDLGGSSRELDRIQCSGGVQVTRKDASGKLLPGEQAKSDRAVFEYDQRKITMTGAAPTITRGSETLTGKELVIFLDEERLLAPQDSRITLCAAPAEKSGKAAPPKTEVTSDSSDLNYGGNKLVFQGNVKVRDPRMSLDCDRLEIYLSEKGGATAAKKQKSAGIGDALDFDGGKSAEKFVSKVICIGNVRSQDPRADLSTDRMTLNFEELKPGEQADSAVFQSNGTRLAKIVCEGNLEMVNRPDTAAEGRAAKDPTNPFGNMLGNSKGPRTLRAERGIVDLVKNESEFHDKVSLVDDQGTLKCEDMYLFTRKSVPQQAAAAPVVKPPVEEDPDADPFSTEAPAKGSVPARIALTDTLELARVLCKRNVEISRRTKEGELQRAGGEQADYRVEDKKIIMTGTPESRPWMSAQGGRISGDRILVDLANETMKVLGNTVVDIGESLKL